MLTESEPHYRRPLLPTPFHERSRALAQVDSFIPWAGYSTVDVFTTVEQEYFAIRNSMHCEMRCIIWNARRF